MSTTYISIEEKTAIQRLRYVIYPLKLKKLPLVIGGAVSLVQANEMWAFTFQWSGRSHRQM